MGKEMIAALFGDLIPYIVMALTAVAGIWGYGRLEKRKGAQERDAKRDAQDAQAERETHERINEADTGAGLDDDQRRERLRDFAAKHGTRPPKAGGR
jgi:hypothetical protein